MSDGGRSPQRPNDCACSESQRSSARDVLRGLAGRLDVLADRLDPSGWRCGFVRSALGEQFRIDASPTITWEQTVVGFVYRRGQVARDAHICGFVCEWAGVPVIEFSERRGFIDFWTGKKDAELAAEELRIAVARHRQPSAYR